MSEQSHPAPFTLERYVAGDLAPGERDGVACHVDSCERCRATTLALRLDIESFTREVPYAAFAARRVARLERAPRSRGLRLALPIGLGLGLAAAAALVVFAVPAADDGVTRVKGGGTTLAFRVQDGEQLRPGTTGETLPSGTRVQLTYEADGHGFVALVGIDPSGRITVYYPEDGDALAPLPAGRTGAFPFGLTLDETPGIERFVAVFGPTPLPLGEVRQALARMPADAARAGELALPDGLAASTIWIRHAQP